MLRHNCFGNGNQPCATGSTSAASQWVPCFPAAAGKHVGSKPSCLRRSAAKAWQPTAWGLARGSTPATQRAGFTLVEMLVAMAITLVMMAAVVTLFANVSNSVRNRRATIEMSGQLRHVRNVLQQDLQGATCPGLTWQRPESNHGYIEIIEGQYRDSFPSLLTDGVQPPTQQNPELDYDQSIVPRANDGSLVQFDPPGDLSGRIASNANGLGDYDDILMLTVRNESEPFVGRVPPGSSAPNGQTKVRQNATDTESFRDWGSETTESTLAEVVWFAIENPDEENRANNFFGEPGMRTIYRRTLMIAPWLNPYQYRDSRGTTDTFNEGGATFKAEPGLVRLLRDDIEKDSVAAAIAALIAFQDRYDLSVRLEWDHNIGNDGRWKIMANTLGDLTKRENRFGHYGFRFGGGAAGSSRVYPYAMVSWGSGYDGDQVQLLVDSDIDDPDTAAQVTAHLGLNDAVVSYSVDQPGAGYLVRPFVFVEDSCDVPSTANAILNDEMEIVRVVHGPVPLWGTRRGEDVMMTDALTFDLRVFDPGAPLFGVRQDPTDPTSDVTTILEPSDAGWIPAYRHPDNTPLIGTSGDMFPYSGQGAYVDMGYGFDRTAGLLAGPKYATAFSSASAPWFYVNRALSDVFGNQLAPGYSVYDTWSFHYENNGRDDDDRDNDQNTLTGADEGTNGLDDVGNYANPTPPPLTVPKTILGIDDVGERETAPPYDKPLRGMQAIVRVYERDSRAIRQVRVNQHFMPE